MPKATEYIVVEGDTISELQELVRDKLIDGYEIAPGCVVIRYSEVHRGENLIEHIYYQPMIR